MPVAMSLPAPLAVFTRRRTWGELGYAVLGLPQGIAFFVVAVTTLSVGAGLAVTLIGFPVLAATNLFCKVVAREAARGGSALLGEPRWAAAPPALEPGAADRHLQSAPLGPAPIKGRACGRSRFLRGLR